MIYFRYILTNKETRDIFYDEIIKILLQMLNFWWNIRKNTKAFYARRFHIRDLADHYLEWRSAKKHFYYLYMFLCTIWYRLHISVWRRSRIQSQVVKSGSLQTSEVGAKLTFKNLALVVTREPLTKEQKNHQEMGPKVPMH